MNTPHTPHNAALLSAAEHAAAHRLGRAMRWALSILSADEYAKVQHNAVRYADEQADQSVLTRLTALAEYLEGHCEEASK